GFDGDGFSGAADGHVDVLAQRARDIQHDSAGGVVLEPLGGNLQRISAYVEARKSEKPGAIGCGGTGEAYAAFGDGDLGPDDDVAAGIGDHTGDFRVLLRAKR